MEKKGPNRLVGVFSVPGKEKQLVDVSEIQYDYVTEVFIRTAAYEKPTFRNALPEPQYLGAVRGYWRVYHEQDHLGTERPLGLLVTAHLLAANREDAENRSIGLGETMADLVALYTGSPYQHPVLKKLARVGAANGIFEQNVYYYLEDTERVRQIQLKPDQLQNLVARFAQLDPAILQQLELATRWYSISILSPRDSLDGYLAAWIGLESIGPTLNGVYHASGVKAPCLVCGNEAGKDRNRGKAGIEHIIKTVASEALDGRTLDDLLRIRNEIAHGLRSASQLRIISGQLLPDLQVSLAIGILTSGGRGKEPILHLSAFLPRDFAFRPDARATIKCETELVNHQPYFGEWINIEREFLNESSRRTPAGGYVWGAGARLRYAVTAPPEQQALIKTEYVMFDRHGAIWTDLETGPQAIPVIAWREKPEPASWERVRQAAEES